MLFFSSPHIIVSSIPTVVGVAGYIYNVNGTVVSGASVTITNNDTGDADTGITNVNGIYVCSLFVEDGDILLLSVTFGGNIGMNNTIADLTLLTQWINATLSPGILKADFMYNPARPVPGQTIHFRDRSIGGPSSWNWDFGDNITIMGRNKDHIYNKSGAYTVTLTIKKGNLTDSVKKTVHVIDVGMGIPPLQPPNYPYGYSIEEVYSIINGDKLGKNDAEIVIVVMDSGLYPFSYNNVSSASIEMMHLSNLETGNDFFGHGTFVNYEIAYLFQLKMQNARQISYRAFDDKGKSTSAEFLESLEDIKTLHPDLLSLSAGGNGLPDDEFSKKIKELHDMGVIVICAAGNSGPMQSTILSPACSKNAIAVGASDPVRTIPNPYDDKICPWSSRGPVDGIDEPKPDVVAPGESIRGPWRDTIKVTSGTSMATPLIAAGGAVIVGNNKLLIDLVKIFYFYNKGVVPDAFEDAIQKSCISEGDANAWGAGLVQLDRAADIFFINLVLLLLFPILLITACILIIIYFLFIKKLLRKKK